MGLDTTHNAWHGSYSSFNQFRHWLAEQIGINLDDYYGYGNKGTKELKSIGNDLKYLFDHSDCDGEITAKRCKKIADAIGEVLKTANKEDYYYPQLVQFQKGCLLAYSQDEKLEFA